MPDTIAVRVARGAALLDARDPGWLAMISLATLDMRCNCVIHQVGGGASFITTIADLGLSEDDAIDLGFWWDIREEISDKAISREIKALDAEWRRLIESRRAAS